MPLKEIAVTRRCVYVCLLLCLAGGCSLSEDLHLSSLAQAYRCNEVIQELEAQRAAGQHLSSFRLFFFSYAYLYVRRYDKVLVAADLLEQSVAAGDTGAFGGSLRALLSEVGRALGGTGLHAEISENTILIPLR